MTQLPQIGDIVTNYRLVAKITKGGMGTVWEARATDGTRVAIKFIHPAMLAAHPELSLRLQREAAAAQCIDSPQIVDVHDSGTWGNLPYIVMEYVPGHTLRVAARKHRWTLPRAKRVVGEIARALETAHAHGIVHRDIKPSNIMLTGDDTVKVLDFGLAKVLLEGSANITAEGSSLGSPSFMSPEQMAASNRVDERADLWSLACIAYFLLTGTRPFTGHIVGQTIANVLRREYAPPSQLRPELGSDVDQWFERAFAHHVDDRFESAAELAGTFAALRTRVFADSITNVMTMRSRRPPPVIPTVPVPSIPAPISNAPPPPMPSVPPPTTWAARSTTSAPRSTTSVAPITVPPHIIAATVPRHPAARLATLVVGMAALTLVLIALGGITAG